MAWCARNTYGVEAANLSNHDVLRTYAWLTWDDSRVNKTNLSQIHGDNLHLMHVNLQKVTSYTKQVFHKRDMKIMLTKVSNTSLMFNMNHGGVKMLLMGSTATHRNFHITGIPPLCEQCDSIGQTKRCNGVCSRVQPRIRQHYEHRWFWLDLRIAHTQIKDWLR